MAKSVLTGAQDFRFKDHALHGVLEGTEDELPMRLATYEYLKRDGAEVEPMGAGQKKWSFRCAFMGADCTARYKGLAADIQREPRGPLTHPRLGFFNAACAALRARESYATAIDVIEFTLELVENQLDQGIQTTEQYGAQRRASQLKDALTQVSEVVTSITENRVANIVYSALISAVYTLSQYAFRFLEFCLQVSQLFPDQVAEDPTLVATEPLDKLLAQVKQKRDLLLSALDNTLPYTLESEVSLTDAKTACYIAYAASVDLYRATLAQRPPIVPFTVPAAMPLTVIAVRIYGKSAKQRIGEIYALNRIVTPYWIPAGTVLRIVSPQDDGR